MTNSGRIIYEPRAGESIKKAAENALALSREKDQKVHLIFCDATSGNIEVALRGHKDTLETVMDKFNQKRERLVTEYWASPAGRARHYKHVKSRQLAQKEMKKVISSMDAALRADDDTKMEWFGRYADIADNIYLRKEDRYLDEVLAALEAAGYRKEDASFKEEEAADMPSSRMVNVMAGNIMGFLETGMPPHPNPVFYYMDEYKKKRQAEMQSPAQAQPADKAPKADNVVNRFKRMFRL